MSNQATTLLGDDPTYVRAVFREAEQAGDEQLSRSTLQGVGAQLLALKQYASATRCATVAAKASHPSVPA